MIEGAFARRKIWLLIGLGVVVIVGTILGFRILGRRSAARVTPTQSGAAIESPTVEVATSPTTDETETASPDQTPTSADTPRSSSPKPAATKTTSAAAAPAATSASPTATASEEAASPSPSATTPSPSPTPTAALAITSSAFGSGQTIPTQYSCDGQNINPPLALANPPAGTQSFALIMDDPDAPNPPTSHWLLWNIGPTITQIAEGSVPAGATQGMAYDGVHYAGPCPPSGENHRYYFRLYALDTTLTLASGSARSALDAAMSGHILTQAELMGRYASP